MLDCWRADRALPWAVLLPFPTDGATLFGSLLQVTAEVSASADAVQRDVTDVTSPESARALGGALARLSRRRGPRGVSSSLSRPEAWEVLRCDILIALAALWSSTPPLALWRPGAWARRGGARFFILTPDASTRSRRPELLRIMRDDGGAEFEPALHATHQVALHLHEGRHQLRPGKSPEKARTSALVCLDDLRPAPSMSHFGPAHEYQDLLKRSHVVGSADLAALYLCDRSGRNLSLVASVGTKRAPQTVPMNTRSALAFVVERDRPRVTNHAVTEPLTRAIEPRWLGNLPAPADFSEIVVPVTNTAPADSVIGALLVQKRARDDDDVFDIHDLNQLELLCSSIALRRSNLLFEEATDRLSELTGHTMLASSASLEVESLEAPWRTLPADIVSARQSLERAVRLAHSYTPAMATVLYLLDRRQERLVPAAIEGDPMFDARRIPMFDEASTTIELAESPRRGRGFAATVLTFGEVILIANVRDAQALRPYNGRITRDEWAGTPIRCAVALPITIFDRTVGVLELVSERAGALEASRSFSQAVAHQICSSLLLAQRAEEQRAFVFASSTALHAHEILKRVDALHDLADERVSAIAREIRAHVLALQDPESRDGMTAHDPIEIIERALERTQLSEFGVWKGTRGTFPPVSPSVSLALERAAYEVLENAKAHLASDGASMEVKLTTRQGLRGGLPRLVIEIEHCADTAIDAAVEAKIYRTPIDDQPGVNRRRHFGAFTAGYWMRAVGGDVYIWRNETDRDERPRVGTAIEVPLLALAPTARGW